VFVMLPLRLRAGVRYIELYMVLYCICTLTCTPSLYGLYNERSPPLIRVCGVCPTLYIHGYGVDTYPGHIPRVSVSDTYPIRDTHAPCRIRVLEVISLQGLVGPHTIPNFFYANNSIWINFFFVIPCG